MDGAVQDLALMLVAIAHPVLRLQVLDAEAGREEDLRHDTGDVLLEVFVLRLFERGEVEKFCRFRHGLHAHDQR